MYSLHFTAEKLSPREVQGCAKCSHVRRVCPHSQRAWGALNPSQFGWGEGGKGQGDRSRGETPSWLTKTRQAHPHANPLAHQKSSHTPPQYDKDILLSGFRQPQDREETKRVYELTRQETQAHKPASLGALEDCVPQSLSSCIFSSTRLLAINLLALPRLSGSSVTSCPSPELPWDRKLFHSLISFFLLVSVHPSISPSIYPSLKSLLCSRGYKEGQEMALP